jgi:hypothetical protein
LIGEKIFHKKGSISVKISCAWRNSARSPATIIGLYFIYLLRLRIGATPTAFFWEI